MEKRSRRRTRDLVTQPASQGLSQNEIGCARISMMAKSMNAPFKGRIQKRKTKPLHSVTSGLQHTAGPYSWVINCRAGHRPSAAARHLIADTNADGRRGRDGPISDIRYRQTTLNPSEVRRREGLRHRPRPVPYRGE